MRDCPICTMAYAGVDMVPCTFTTHEIPLARALHIPERGECRIVGETEKLVEEGNIIRLRDFLRGVRRTRPIVVQGRPIWQILTKIIVECRHQRILLGGDLNANASGLRVGYAAFNAEHMKRVDELLTQFVTDTQGELMSPSTVSWRQGSKGAKLDHIGTDDTIHKLRDLHPERSLDLSLENMPTPEALNDFWDSDEGIALKNKWFNIKKVRKYFCNFQALGASDIDGWRGREHARHLFMNNDAELHHLIFDELIFPYITGEFLAKFLPELAGGLLFAFLKKTKGLRPLFCGSLWRRRAARLVCDCTRDAAHKYFTTTYPNFMQCAGGLQDGATRCAQLLMMKPSA